MGTSKESEPKPLDWLGAVMIGGAVAALVFGTLEAPIQGWSDPLIISCLAVGAVLAFATGSAAITVFFAALFGFFYLVMQCVQFVMGYTPIQTAFALTPLMVPVLTLSIASAWILPRVGLRTLVFVGLMLIATGLLCLRLLQRDSPYWDLAWPLLVMSSGIGLCIRTNHIRHHDLCSGRQTGCRVGRQRHHPRDRRRTRHRPAGSMLAAQYTDDVSAHLATLPAPVREAAGSSLGQALEVAGRMGPRGAELATAAQAAFLQGMESALLALAALVVVSAVVISLWAPGRNGRQLRFV